MRVAVEECWGVAGEIPDLAVAACKAIEAVDWVAAVRSGEAFEFSRPFIRVLELGAGSFASAISPLLNRKNVHHEYVMYVLGERARPGLFVDRHVVSKLPDYLDELPPDLVLIDSSDPVGWLRLLQPIVGTGAIVLLTGHGDTFTSGELSKLFRHSVVHSLEQDGRRWMSARLQCD